MKKILSLSLVVMFFMSCEEEVNRNPELANELANEGIALLQQNEIEEALEKFEAALVEDDSNEDAYANMIQIYLYQEEYDKAQETTEKALKVSPDVGENWILAGIFHEKKGNKDKAKEYYKKSLAKFEAAYEKSLEEDIQDDFGFMRDQITPQEINIIFANMLLDDRARVEELVAKLKEKDSENPMIDKLLDFDREMYIQTTFPGMD